MNEALRSNIQEVEREIESAEAALALFRRSDTSPDQRKAWEAFLYSFSRGTGKLITLGLTSPATRALAHRLKNAWQTDDPGLVYLREARNVAEHGLEPSAKFKDSVTSIAGGIHLAGNVNIFLSGNVINGRPTGTFELNTLRGKPSSILGNPGSDVLFTPAQTVLVPVRNPEKKTKIFNPPASVFDKHLPVGDAEQLAQAALDGLAGALSEFKQAGVWNEQKQV